MKLSMYVQLTGEDIADLQYPVMVMAWHKAVGAGASGRKREAFKKEFNEKERRILSRYYSRFHRWYLVTGPPQKCSIKATTYALLQRAIQFFATI
jgi:hypothetical protein